MTNKDWLKSELVWAHMSFSIMSVVHLTMFVSGIWMGFKSYPHPFFIGFPLIGIIMLGELALLAQSYRNTVQMLNKILSFSDEVE